MCGGVWSRACAGSSQVYPRQVARWGWIPVAAVEVLGTRRVSNDPSRTSTRIYAWKNEGCCNTSEAPVDAVYAIKTIKPFRHTISRGKTVYFAAHKNKQGKTHGKTSTVRPGGSPGGCRSIVVRVRWQLPGWSQTGRQTGLDTCGSKCLCPGSLQVCPKRFA